MKSVIGFGEVCEGKLKLRNESAFREQLSQLKGVVRVVVERMYSKRSLLQNAYYWGMVIKILSDELGYDPDDIHEILKLKFNSKRISIADEETTIGASTTQLSTIDFMAYIEQIQRWAATFLHIDIPSPNEVS